MQRIVGADVSRVTYQTEKKKLSHGDGLDTATSHVCMYVCKYICNPVG